MDENKSIEVTPQMIEAGVQAYMTCGIDPDKETAEFVEAICRAMLVMAKSPRKKIRSWSSPVVLTRAEARVRLGLPEEPKP